MVIYLSKHFLQTQSFFIVWNQKQLIFDFFKVLLRIFNYSVEKFSNLESSFSIIYTSWKNKTFIISTQTFRAVILLSKTFLQTQSFFIVWNQKQMIFILGKTGWRKRKLLNFKRSRKTFTQDTKAISNYIYLL